MSNKENHPEAWVFFAENARNMGNYYRIPEPNKSGLFINTTNVCDLWSKFINKWYEPNLNSESITGKIQYITTYL